MPGAGSCCSLQFAPVAVGCRGEEVARQPCCCCRAEPSVGPKPGRLQPAVAAVDSPHVWIKLLNGFWCWENVVERVIIFDSITSLLVCFWTFCFTVIKTITVFIILHVTVIPHAVTKSREEILSQDYDLTCIFFKLIGLQWNSATRIKHCCF